MSSLVLAGLAVSVGALGIRTAIRSSGPLAKKMEQAVKQLSSMDYKYYRGGFESKMSKREAGLILGVNQSAPKKKISEAHRRIMLLNHPDKGGSPFLAAKINQAKDLMDK